MKVIVSIMFIGCYMYNLKVFVFLLLFTGCKWNQYDLQGVKRREIVMLKKVIPKIMKIMWMNALGGWTRFLHIMVYFNGFFP